MAEVTVSRGSWRIRLPCPADDYLCCAVTGALFPRSIRIAIICGNLSPHLSTAKDGRVGTWAKANNVEIAATSTNSSWLNRIEAMFAALRYFALDGTGHASCKEQPA
jgi:hypothetical protein